jgi:hypothetical protein
MSDPDPRSLHEQLLDDPTKLILAYDEHAQAFIEVGRREGHYEGWSDEDLRWPLTPQDGATPFEGDLERRVRLVRALEEGVPGRREGRLQEAHENFERLAEAYYAGSELYLEVKVQFEAGGHGSAEALLEMYQALYLEALAKGDLFSPDVGEAALGGAGVTHVPLSRAQAVAEALKVVATVEEPLWDLQVHVEGEGVTLKDALTRVAGATLDYVAAGGLMATRYNVYTNFSWFGCSVWRVLLEAELLLAKLYAAGKGRILVRRIRSEFPRAMAVMIEWVQAHQEDPSRIKPNNYWYGSEYSYLTRGMIDGSSKLARTVNRLIARYLPDERPIDIPPLIESRWRGTFSEYTHVGKSGEKLGKSRLAAWVWRSVRYGRTKKKLAANTELNETSRHALAWQNWTDYANDALDTLGIEVDVKVDPEFGRIAKHLNFGEGGVPILFSPTHRNLLDHLVFYHVLQHPELLSAMGWERTRPCSILSKTGLIPGIRLGGRTINMFGMSGERFDRYQKEVDGYVMLDRSGPGRHTTREMTTAMETRPGVIYAMGTTSAFDLQSLPLQHGMFALIPPDSVIVPLAYRGIYGLWPRCPMGNTNLSSGKVEVYISPPIVGETTLLPRRRSLRVQAEAAALLQAIHIGALFDPEGSERMSA